MSRLRRRSWVVFPLIGLGVFLTPLLWRLGMPVWVSNARPASYLPSLEPSRDRAPFNPAPIESLRAYDPMFVLVGDSMTNRIHFNVLDKLTGRRSTTVHDASTGSAYWFLTFKNHIVASGIRPAWVVVFFRDNLLTEPRFRLTGRNRLKVDSAALDYEPELDRALAARSQGLWYRIHRTIDDAYGIERAREWIEPRLTAWPARVVAGTLRKQTLLDDANKAFALDRLRVMTEDDIGTATTSELDFDANLRASILPDWIALARAQGLRLLFVRVLKRPVNGQPPPESPELQRYVRDLRAYFEREGVAYLDDRDDPTLATLPYGDGDHVANRAREPYTIRFWEKVQALR